MCRRNRIHHHRRHHHDHHHKHGGPRGCHFAKQQDLHLTAEGCKFKRFAEMSRRCFGVDGRRVPHERHEGHRGPPPHRRGPHSNHHVGAHVRYHHRGRSFGGRQHERPEFSVHEFRRQGSHGYDNRERLHADCCRHRRMETPPPQQQRSNSC